MKNEHYGIITFNSTHHTISAEKVLEENNIPFKTVPTPREITLSCGLSILFPVEDMEKVNKLIDAKMLSVKGKYSYTIEDNVKTIKEME